MASFSVPCPKVSPLLALQSTATQKRHDVVSFPRSDSGSNASIAMAQSQVRGRGQSDVFKVCAKLNDVALEELSNANPTIATEPILELEKESSVPDASSFSAFMNQVSDLVKLVDSKDIVELQLKQTDCEILIRKADALPKPSIAAVVPYAPPPPQQAMLPPQLPPPSSASVPAPTPAAPPKPKSSYPPFTCPMAGNFYRSSAPGAPPFVKVGDKVQKGQVLCIIEAMKLMNEIESDLAGTVVDILADDGKPVSVDMPLFIIEP